MESSSPNKTLACYLRVSTESQIASSIKSQREYAAKKAQAEGLTPVFYEDHGLSASTEDNLSKRKGMLKLIADVKEHKIKNIYTIEQTRFSRNDKVTGELWQIFRKYEVRIFYFHGNSFSLTNAVDRLQATVIGAVAMYEADVRLFRFQIGRLIASRNGRFLGPNPPFGYSKINSPEDRSNHGKLKLKQDEVEVYKLMVKWCLEGNGTYKIANMLNSRGFPTKSSSKKNRKSWNAGTVRSILKNPLYKGKRKYTDEFVPCPPIIDEEVWDNIQKRFKANTIHNKRHNTVHKYLLKGLIKCGVCGESYFGKTKKNRGEYLYCCLSKRSGYKSCGNKNINIFRLENFVLKTLIGAKGLEKALSRLYENPEKIEHLETELTSLNKAIIKRKAELKNTARLIVEVDDNEQELMQAYEELKKEKLQNISELNSNIEGLKRKIDSLKLSDRNLMSEYIVGGQLKIDSFDEKRALVIDLIESVTIVNHDSDSQKHNVIMLFRNEVYKPVVAGLSSKPYYRSSKEEQEIILEHDNLITEKGMQKYLAGAVEMITSLSSQNGGNLS